MATYDWTGTDIIPNGSGSAVRADLNDVLLALFSQNSSATEPPETVAYMPWADTANGLYKIRNAANSDWITLYQLDGEWTTIALENGTAAAPSLYFKDSGTDTGVYSPDADQVAITTAGVQRVNFNAGTEVVFNDGGADVDFRIEGDTEPNLFKIDAGTDQVQVANLNGGPLSGTRNRIINGAMAVDARNAGASQTFTAAAALAYSVDRWYGYCTGANVTGQQVQGATVGQYRYQFTGAASVTAIGFGQRIEQLNSADLAGTTATLSVDLANSLLTTVTWTAYYATTANAFGTLASPTRTQIATGTFTVTSTATRYSTNISIPAAATTGIEIVFTVGAQTSGTWTIGDVQLERGTVATPFERRNYGDELLRCQRYFLKTGDIGSANEWVPGVATYASYGFAQALAFDDLNDRAFIIERFPTAMRVTGTVTFYPGRSGVTNTAGEITIYNGDTSVTTTLKPTASTRGFEGYFSGTSTDAKAYTMQYTVDSEL